MELLQANKDKNRIRIRIRISISIRITIMTRTMIRIRQTYSFQLLRMGEQDWLESHVTRKNGGVGRIG